MNMNREILRIALPNIVSNITVPLMGIVSTAIAGHWGADSAATIGALAIGVSIFNFIYWNCSFVRMGTSGLTAQAFGAGNFHECTNMLVRAMVVAAGMGLLMLALQYPLGELALCIGNMDVPIVAVSAKRDEKKKTSSITMVIQVKSREQLDRVFTQLHKRSDIIEVYRGST